MVVIAVDSDEIARYLLTDADGRQYILLSDGTTTAYVEPGTGGLTVSRAVHRRVTQSNMWVSSYVKAALAAGADFYFHLKVGAAKNAHITFAIDVEAEATAALYENPTTTDDGTALTEVNMNRQTIVAATLEVFRDPTVTADGLQLEISKIGAGSRVRAAGGESDSGGYWLLKKSEQYLIKVTNDDANVQDVSIMVVWHED